MKKADKIVALNRLADYTDWYIGECFYGLCAILMDCVFKEGEYQYLDFLLRKEAKLRDIDYGKRYIWRRGSKAPRIKWINEQIKKLEKK
jgi:hypothetical protein